MDDLATLVEKARSGDSNAFGEIVRRFQAMAHGYAYSMLGDFGMAEDVAQEAFIEAYLHLADLKAPEAFPAWFRRIVFKHSNRVTRRKQVRVVSLDDATVTERVAAQTPGPARLAEQRETQEMVTQAIRALSEHQRTATTLFYINGYTQDQIADFLEVPVTTVKKRLHDSRKQLKGRMIEMVSDTLKNNTVDEHFWEKVITEVRDLNSQYLPQMEELFHYLFRHEHERADRALSQQKNVELSDSMRPRPWFREIIGGSKGHDAGETGAQVFVGIRDEKVAGLLQIFYRLWNDSLVSWVDILGVVKPFAGMGLEQALLARAVQATRETAERHRRSALGILSLTNSLDIKEVDEVAAVFEKAGGQVRRDLVYRCADEEPGCWILYLPLQPEYREIATKRLAWELWQFGGLPKEEFERRYGGSV